MGAREKKRGAKRAILCVGDKKQTWVIKTGTAQDRKKEYWSGERERERERKIEKETDRQTDRHRERQRESRHAMCPHRMC